MAPGASHPLMLSGQRIFRHLVIGFRKRGRLPTRDYVTRPAFAVIGAADELPLVLIHMAVDALLVLNRLLEI